MRTIALVVFLMAQNRGPAKTETPGPVLSVCEVLADDPTKFNGKLIALEGEFVYGTEGMWLVGEGCKTQLVTKGLKWGHDIAVSVDPGIDSVAISWERLTKRLQRLRVKPDDKLMVTIVGRLETRDSLNDMVIQMPYGLRHFGFGHMGDSPAEINVVSIEFKQLKRERNPQKTRKRNDMFVC